MRHDVLDLYLANMRYRELLHGDLLAQLGLDREGPPPADRAGRGVRRRRGALYVEEIMDYADRRMSAEISAMPDGEYTGEGWVDSDGIDQTDLPIKVRVRIAGDRVEVDFTGSAPQARGGVNGSLATSQAAAAIPFLYYVDPTSRTTTAASGTST